MLRATRRILRPVDWNRSQVVGAEIPSYARFPYRASDTLRLYRKFLQLVDRLPPSERGDALFKLRNEFRSKRHLAGSKRLGHAYHRGLDRYEYYKGILDERDVKARGLVHGVRGDGVTMESTDAAWATLTRRCNGTVPNLRNVIPSKRLAVSIDRWSPFSSSYVQGFHHSSR